MADREIRIPITIELNANTRQQANKQTTPTQTTTPSKTQTASPKQSSGVGQAISAGLLIESSKKLLTASGNTQASQVIEKGVKYGTLLARSASGDVTAMITMAVEISAEALKKVQELKEEAKQNNLTMYNKIKTGQVYLGSNDITVTTDYWGNKTYNKR